MRSAIQRTFNRFPGQLVVYVGELPLRMVGRISEPGLSFECAIVDIRELESEPLLESRILEDNIVAVLGRLSDGIGTIRRILARIAENDPARRSGALAELTILAGLRSLGTVVERELERMPILNDIMDHEVIGRERKRGRSEGERTVILSMMAERFGPVPAWARERVETLGYPELEKIAPRLLKAGSLEDLLG